MKTQTKHRIRIVLAAPLVVFLAITSALASSLEDIFRVYRATADRALDRLSNWIIGDDLERWMGLWEKRLSGLDPERITLEAVAKAMDIPMKAAKRLCGDATRQEFFAMNDDGSYRLAR